MCPSVALEPMKPPAGDLAIATAVSLNPDTRSALSEIAQGLGIDRAGTPDFVALHHGSARPVTATRPAAIEVFGAAALHGASSCLGVMTECGPAFGNGDGIGALAIWDAEGSYGTAMSDLGTDPAAAAARTLRKALTRAGRPGEAPDLVWLTATPGHEEEILQGIKGVIGGSALIVGGSAADNEVAGGWSIFSSEGIAGAGVVISVLFPSAPLGCSFESGYVPTALHGTVTAADDRRLLRIDGRPAAEVYAEWTGGRIQPPVTGSRSILSDATLSPLGREQAEVAGIPVYCLVHPAIVHADGSMELFARVEPGDELWFMQGSSENLVQRAGGIAANCRVQLGDTPVSGALLVYCGGCMLAIRERMNEVAKSLADNLGDAPFLGVFSFGEQGEMPEGDAVHGNLMISCVTFGFRQARDWWERA